MKKSTIISAALIAAIILASSGSSVFAQGKKLSPKEREGANKATTTLGTTTREKARNESQEKKISQIKEQAVREIERRVEGLKKLQEQIASMKRVSQVGKTNLRAFVQKEIDNLLALKTKIQSETNIETLRTYVKSINQSYRIYALVIPEGHILATADQLISTADAIASTTAKLETRISEAAASGKDVSAFKNLITDIKARISNAKVLAESAVASLTSLVPDNGDESKFQANKDALNAARKKIKDGEKDLKVARQNIDRILKGLKVEFKNDTRATSTKATSTKVISTQERATSTNSFFKNLFKIKR